MKTAMNGRVLRRASFIWIVEWISAYIEKGIPLLSLLPGHYQSLCSLCYQDIFSLFASLLPGHEQFLWWLVTRAWLISLKACYQRRLVSVTRAWAALSPTSCVCLPYLTSKTDGSDDTFWTCCWQYGLTHVQQWSAHDLWATVADNVLTRFQLT